MIYEVDLVRDIVFLIDGELRVTDAFAVAGKTRYHSSYPVCFYTYKSLITTPGFCCLCGRPVEQKVSPCASVDGFHAFVGVHDRKDVEEGHQAGFRALPIKRISYEDLDFFLEADNLFPIEEIQKPMAV